MLFITSAFLCLSFFLNVEASIAVLKAENSDLSRDFADLFSCLCGPVFLETVPSALFAVAQDQTDRWQSGLWIGSSLPNRTKKLHFSNSEVTQAKGLHSAPTCFVLNLYYWMKQLEIQIEQHFPARPKLKFTHKCVSTREMKHLAKPNGAVLARTQSMTGFATLDRDASICVKCGTGPVNTGCTNRTQPEVSYLTLSSTMASKHFCVSGLTATQPPTIFFDTLTVTTFDERDVFRLLLEAWKRNWILSTSNEVMLVRHKLGKKRNSGFDTWVKYSHRQPETSHMLSSR